MRKRIWFGVGLAATAFAVIVGQPAQQTTIAQQKAVPRFEVDAKFPQIPDRKMMGGVGGVAADSHGNVWAITRPHTVGEDNAGQNGYTPLASVVEWDPTGKFLQAWGDYSKTKEYEWFTRGGPYRAGPDSGIECPACGDKPRGNGNREPGGGEHGIYVDAKDNVWLTGNGNGDGQVLKFTKNGKFLLQIGHCCRKGEPVPGAGQTAVDSNNTENVADAAEIFMYAKTNEVFVADGYGNRRVIVFDADTGKYKRHWGAYGNKPDDKASKARVPTGPPPQQFNTVHGVFVANDIVYAADRSNNRIQTFTLDGKFLKEGFVKRESKGTGTAFGVAVSPDNRFVYVADGSNERVAILDRASLEEIGSFGRPGASAGQFYHLHGISVDPQGNVITGESQGYRVQKFLYKGVGSATN